MTIELSENVAKKVERLAERVGKEPEEYVEWVLEGEWYSFAMGKQALAEENKS